MVPVYRETYREALARVGPDVGLDAESVGPRNYLQVPAPAPAPFSFRSVVRHTHCANIMK